jgi:ABC-type nitrate/sulfonate/bicarbonate transport system ATPase subunit
MLRVINGAKTFTRSGGRVGVFSNLDLEIRPGEIFGLVGPSGSGKSTLLRVLAGLESLDGGVVERATTVGLAFQDPSLFPWLTVRQNVALAARFKKNEIPDDGRIDGLIQEFGLARFADSLPDSLSGGQAQRAAFARALLTRPGVLLADEPFGALDPPTRVALQDWLLDFRSTHETAMVFVTHDVGEAILLCNRVGLLLPESSGFAGCWDVPTIDRADIPDHRITREILSTYHTDVGAPLPALVDREPLLIERLP